MVLEKTWLILEFIYGNYKVSQPIIIIPTLSSLKFGNLTIEYFY